MIARSYRRTLRGKVMLPAAVLFVAFALAAVVGYTRQTTRDMEQAAEETLRREAELFDHILADERERVALQSRFLADMIELSSALPSSTDGRPIVLSLIDHLGQQPVRSRVVTLGDSGRDDSVLSHPDGHGSGSSTTS